MSIIKIKRSGTTGAPSSLATGELAYSYFDAEDSNLSSGGLRLYAGVGTESNGEAASIEVIGGRYFTEKLDHAPGTLVANSAIIVDASGAIDTITIGNLTVANNTVISTGAINLISANNTNIVLGTTGTGVISANSSRITEVSTPTLGTDAANKDYVDNEVGNALSGAFEPGEGIDITANSTVVTISGEDASANNKGIASFSDVHFTVANGNVEANSFDIGSTTLNLGGNTDVLAGLTSIDVGDFDISGNTISNPTGDITISANGTIILEGIVSLAQADFDGQVTMNSLNVEDLTDGRVILAGANGELQDTADLTYSSNTFNIGQGSVTITNAGVGTVSGQWNVDTLRLDDGTISSTDVDGNILIDPNGNGYVQIVGTNGLVIPVGTDAQQGPNVQGAIRFNSEIDKFEGYSGTNWQSLGGVRSVDGLTFISAELNPGDSDDTLYFYAATSDTESALIATIDSVGIDVSATTSSTNTATGSIVTAGGVGIAENLNVGGDINITGDLAVNGGDITSTATTINLFADANTVNIGDANSTVNVLGTLNAGSFIADGNTVETTGNLVVGGDLTVNGNTVTVNVSTLNVEDPLIRLAANNTADTLDIGFVGNFNDGTGDKFAGMFRDATDNEWYIFDEYVDAQLDDNVIDRTSPTFLLGNVNANAFAFANTVISLTGDIAGSVTIDSFGAVNYDIQTSIQANSVELSTDTTGDYVASVTANTATGISATGTGEGASVLIQGIIANTAGQVGVSSYNANNFNVSLAGEVEINIVDGGTF